MTSTLPPLAGHPATGQLPPRPHRPGRRGRWVALIALLALGWPLFSYAQALPYPGDASVEVRTVEWVRDHGGGPLVDLAESWWYAHPTVTSTPDPGSLPPPPTSPPPVSGPAPLPALAGSAPLPGEGVWVAGQPAADGSPAIYTTFERPNPDYPGVIAGVALIDQTRTRMALIPGTRQPDRSTAAAAAQVAPADRKALVATFNSGFEMADAHGGFYLDGRTFVPLRGGAVSLVIDRNGTATVARWGRDAVAGPNVVAVRQNLDLIVEGGQPVSGLDLNADGTWGTLRNQLQYTWRSGVGVDAAGHLLYVGGGNMTLKSLAAALANAGAVRAMQLDIHGHMVDLYSYRHTGGNGVTSTKLLPDMLNSGRRYLVPDQRDFFAVLLRSGPADPRTLDAW